MPKSSEKGARPVPSIDLAAERRQVGEALQEAVLRVLDSGRYVLGPEVEAFEREFAALHGARHCVGLASGTDAVILGLLALGVRPGDDVLTSPFTFFATVGAIAWIGARPRFADIDPRTALLDPERAAKALDSRTRCILPVHLYGQLCDMKSLRALADERDLALLEDAAQAHGATRDGIACGELGDAAAFSFYPTKNLGAAGEAGAVITTDPSVDRRLRELRDHGAREKYMHASLGTNSRMHAMQGAVLAAKLPHLPGWTERRRAVAERYDLALSGLDHLVPLARAEGSDPVFHQYAVRVLGGGRDALLERLRAEGIGAAVHYPLPVHLQQAARPFGYGPGDFPEAEALAREVLCLPIHPFLEPQDLERVCSALSRRS